MTPTIALVYNTSQYLFNLRRELMAELARNGYRVVGIAPRDEASAKLEAMGIRFIHVALQGRGQNPWSDWAGYRQLRSIFARERPDVVLNYTIKPVIYGSLAASRATAARVYSMVPGLGYLFTDERARVRLLRAAVLPLYRAALRRNRRVFFQNLDDRDLFLRYGLVRQDQPVLVDGSGVDTGRFRPSADRPGEGFLMIARLLREKGVAEYVQAARLLKARHPHVRFRLLGPAGTGTSAFRAEEVADWQRSGAVEYLGETDDVRPHLESCAVFVLPSYREGLSRSLLEAMSMGKPLITTDRPGCREAVVNGGNGILIPARDVEALAAAMERCIGDPKLVHDMGARSRELATSRFDVRAVNRRILETIAG